MFFSNRIIVFTYHGIHNRKIRNSIESKLFRNSLSEIDFISQLKILKGFIKNEKEISFKSRDLLLNEFNIFLTFDDGYKNNFRAAEISHSILGTAPFTVFLITNLIGKINCSVWTVEIALLILCAEFLQNRIEFKDEKYLLNSYEDRLNCFYLIRNYSLILF